VACEAYGAADVSVTAAVVAVAVIAAATGAASAAVHGYSTVGDVHVPSGAAAAAAAVAAGAPRFRTIAGWINA